MDAPDERSSQLKSNLETPDTKDDQQGVRVYDPPARRSFPLWLLILVIVLAIITSWMLFQALR
jgi:hypothetical protein